MDGALMLRPYTLLFLIFGACQLIEREYGLKIVNEDEFTRMLAQGEEEYRNVSGD
ncbi:MAG: hypothetical protein PHV50_02155 [Syntrophaceticus sp.]|nr:hypothetical protein [Syntrophaceticus sp.]